MKQLQQTLLNLISIALGNERPAVNNVDDWEDLLDMAQRHGVAGVVLDGINDCFEKGANFNIAFQTKMDWIGIVSQMEQRYQLQENNMRELASFYNKHGIKMMGLKGYGLSQNYPIRNHRPCGDIDIYLFGEQQRADNLMHDELGIKIDKSHHHHTVFKFHGETVENHYDFLNVHVRKSNKRIETKLKEIVNDNVNLEDNMVLPSVKFNAIYLLRHCAAHFASTEMTVRQVLDWGLFMQKHHKEIKWNEYFSYVKQEGMLRFYNLLGLFCMRHLGFDASIFHGLYSDVLFERFCNEILEPEFKDHEDGTMLRSLSVKPRRWWHNRWKNRLCYTESAWEEFVYGLWAKVLKPSHFRH